MKAQYVITNKGDILVQVGHEDDKLNFDLKENFFLCDDEQSWSKGYGIASYWDLLDYEDVRITPEHHTRMDWILEKYNR